ncbi:YcfA-like protein [Bacteroidales bacterium Barb4]|nr:YcfA-like protein [Bacteroidales bacterium Barb4]
MKYSEFHRIVIRHGWVKVRQSGSHIIYAKNGRKVPIPNHGSKEMAERFRLTLLKELGLELN